VQNQTDSRLKAAIGTQTTSGGSGISTLTNGRKVTAFICANCARSGLVPSSGRRLRPEAPDLKWPRGTKVVVVPCAGRLQPEHLLKAFEGGTDAVCIVGCDEANCHNLQGSRRAKRRMEYVGELLDQIGLGGERLMMFSLPGSAREDLILGSGGQAAAPAAQEDLAGRLKTILDAVAARLKILPRNPLGKGQAGETAEENNEVEDTDDGED
jgi:coenzyme F420-reducing hydrogenase delta subunit